MILDDQIFLYGEIVSDQDDNGYGVVSPSSWIKELHSLSSRRDITVRINSPGGDVTAGWAIGNAVKDFQSLGHNMTAKVDGLAASIASVIALSAGRVLMGESSLLMIHRPMSLVAGNAEDLQKRIAVLEKITEQLVDVYVRKSGQTRKQIEAWMQDETFFTAQEALDAGLIDGIYDERSALTACIDLKRYVPKNVLARARKPVTDLIAEVCRHSALTKQARSLDEARHHAYICASAADRLTRKAGATNDDLSLAASVVERLNVFSNVMMFD